MLLYFKVKNFRSFRDEAILDMEATSIQDSCCDLLPYKAKEYLPSAAVYGKNGGGKSNLIRAMWIAVQFICNAQKTQTENTPIPVQPFALNDYSAEEPTEFEFDYVYDHIEYRYGFSATRDHIVREYLHAWPQGRIKRIFDRQEQQFSFPANPEKKRKMLIQEAVGKNQLFFSIACTMNDPSCIAAMKWFREGVMFASEFPDINRNLIDYREDEDMLRAIVSAAKTADVGIEDIHFEFDHKKIDLESDDIPEKMAGMIAALKTFSEALRKSGSDAGASLSMGRLKSTTYHLGMNKAGESAAYELTLRDESDGTRMLMNLAPAIEKTLANGGVLVVDELEKGLHLLLVEYVLKRYHQKSKNPRAAQVIFTTHETALLETGILRRDQVYFADKNRQDGTSSLYSLSDFKTRPESNIQRAYLLGKFGATPIIDEVN